MRLTDAFVAKTVEEVEQPTQPTNVDAQITELGESLGLPGSVTTYYLNPITLITNSPVDVNDRPGVLPVSDLTQLNQHCLKFWLMKLRY